MEFLGAIIMINVFFIFILIDFFFFYAGIALYGEEHTICVGKCHPAHFNTQVFLDIDREIEHALDLNMERMDNDYLVVYVFKYIMKWIFIFVWLDFCGRSWVVTFRLLKDIIID